MSKLLKYITLFLISLFLLLIATKPSEENFLNRIVDDYSNIHPGIQLSKSDLVEMGSTQYHSQLIYSSFKYKFGQIEVNYWGILGYIINSGYETEGEQEESETKTGTLS